MSFFSVHARVDAAERLAVSQRGLLCGAALIHTDAGAWETRIPESATTPVEIVELECGIDHVHLLIGAKPTLDIPKWINSL